MILPVMKLKKSLGQHILVSGGVLKRISKCLNFSKNDTVVEIGGGTGNLTRELLKREMKRLVVVEIDKGMIEVLKSIKDERLEVVEADARYYGFCSLGDDLYVIGNLPYNAYSFIIENVIRHRVCIKEACFLLQKEVAERIEGKRNVGWLSLLVRSFYEVEYVMTVPPRFFRPPPKVNSGLIKMKRIHKGEDIDTDKYVKLLKMLFADRRKMLRKKVKEHVLSKCGINPEARAEELNPENTLCIYNYMEEKL